MANENQTKPEGKNAAAEKAPDKKAADGKSIAPEQTEAKQPFAPGKPLTPLKAEKADNAMNKPVSPGDKAVPQKEPTEPTKQATDKVIPLYKIPTEQQSVKADAQKTDKAEKPVSENDKALPKKEMPASSEKADGKNVLPPDKNNMAQAIKKPEPKNPVKRDASPDKPAPPSNKALSKKDAPPAPVKPGVQDKPLGKPAEQVKKDISQKKPESAVKEADKAKGDIKPPVAAKTISKIEKAPEAAKPTDKKQAEPTLEKRKAELEKELREKFNIPKSEKTVEPWVAPEVEKVVRISHNELHSFKDHPFRVDKNTKYTAFVTSIRAHGVTQPAIVRPREAGGYEIVSGHRRDEGSKDAGIPYTPCIIRALNDDQAIQQMVEDNVNNRDIGVIELAKALKKQLESLKHQGAQESLQKGLLTSADDVGKRSNQIVAERNGMSVKQVQRHIALTNLTPALQEMVDGKKAANDKTLKLAFTPALEISYISPKNQEYIAVAIEGQQSTPSLSQAQRMRELDQKKLLNPDVIDGIMLEEKKEADKVIISSQELAQYFGKEKTPREMKDTIINLLDEWKNKQKDIKKPEKKNEMEK